MLPLIFTSALVPMLVGCLLAFVPMKTRAAQNSLVMFSLSVSAVCTLVLAFGKLRGEASFFSLTEELRLVCRVDTVAVFFSCLFTLAFLLVAVYAISYFKHDDRKHRFDCFFLLSYGALILLAYSGNLISMYVSFELVTLLSMPLVLHDKTKESVDAALKYLIYSVGGAFLGFIGVVYLSMNATSDSFTEGGVLPAEIVSSAAFGVILFLMLIGFGAKCGLFPLHNWLPTAHPVAPAPASALLSGIITKSGVLAVIRIVYYTVGAELLRVTWVQTAWIVLILLTILLGSFMAAVQKNFKKRLAFSTVSQISYVLLGVAVLDADGWSGAILQISSHAVIKIALFLVAGVLIHSLGIHNVDELDGVGKRMPVTMWCYTVCSLGLVGVPPTGGFVAKWYLASGALDGGLGVLGVIAPVVLIISAILTAYYLLAPAVSAFFPSDKTASYPREKEPLTMIVPLLVFAALTVLIGVFASDLLALIAAL